MNTFSLKKIKDGEGGKAGPNTVEMQLTAVCENGQLGEQMRAAFEIEIMRGTRRPDGVGGCYYYFEVDDEKGQMFAEWLTKAYYQPCDN